MHINTNAFFKLGVLTLVVLIGCVNLYAEEERRTPPKELVQYIQDASRLGLKETQIQENAIRAGWSKAVVNESIAYVRTSTPKSVSGADTVSNTAANIPSSTAAPINRPEPQQSSPAQIAAAKIPSTMETRVQSQQAVELGAGAPDDYHIGAGDVLQISVWKEPEASVPHAVVRPDGKIGLPLLKEVNVIGLTPRQAEKLITERLSKLIPAADVTVVVTGINSKKIYIVGAVKKEGPIPYTYQMTVMQAISEAGGLNDYAKRRKIYILRPENGKDYKLPFDYEAALRGERMELNIPLLPGDTLVVPH